MSVNQVPALAPGDFTTRQRCDMCQRYSPVEFDVPDHIWEASLHPHWHQARLCVTCFAESADERGIFWDQDIQLFPVSLASQFADKLSRDNRWPSRGEYLGPEQVRNLEAEVERNGEGWAEANKQVVAYQELVEATELNRNAFSDGQDAWVVIPREDFDRLRTALEKVKGER